MSVSTDTHNGGDRMVDAMVEFISDILTDHFIMDIEVRRTVAKQLLASGKFVDYAGQKYDLLAEATHQFSTEASERDLFGMQRQTINVRAGLDPAEKTQIATANPDVDVRFTDTTDMPHGVAYAQRIIDTNRALALVDHKYGPVLDIGGNYAAHAMSQRKIDIHSCTLLQGEVEYHRQTQRDVVLEYANVEAGSFCRDGVQNCDFQAVHGISIHALPDIDPDLWPAIFRRHGLEYVVAFFHYDTAMETDAVGYIAAAGMHWHVQESNVHFYFENDSSHGYTHNRNWLLEYGSTWMRTDDDWDFVVLYQVDFVDGGRAQASLTRLQKDTIGAQEITPAYRFIDVDDMMELIVPKFDPSLGKSVHDPRGYGYETVRVPSAMFSYLYRFGLANDTERPDLPLSLDSMREHAHAFNHVRKVNGTDITTPVRLNHQLIDDIALGMYLLVVKRAAMGKVIYTRYTDHMRGLQGRWSKSDVLSMVANSFSYVAIAPFMLLASSMSEVVDLVAMHMRSVVGEEKVLASAQEVLPYRRIMPVRPVHGAAVSDLAGAHYVPRNVVPEHGDIEPRQFFDVFQHTMDESSRRKVEKYLREHEPTDEQEEVAHTPVVQTYIVKFPERRQEWIDAYRLFDGYLEDKHPPVLTSAVQMEDRVEPQLVWEFYAPRVYELSMYMADVGLHVISSAESLMRDTWAGCAPNYAAMHDRNVQEDAGIVYYRVNEGVIDGMQLDDPYNMIIDPHDGRHLEVFVRNAECRVMGAKADFVFACESLRVFNYFQLGRRAYKTAQAMGKPRNVKAVLMDGVPGCGKTFQILQAFTDKDVIVVAVKSTREAILRQLSTDERFKGMQKQLSNRVRTIDSGCMHGIPLAQVLYVDEGLMAHSGALTQLVHESQPAEMRVFGDSEQIALIDRGSKLGDLHFASLFYWTQVVECNETARTPADATYVWSRLYPESRRDKIRTFSPVLRSMTFEHIPDVKSPQYTDAKYPYVYYSVLRADRGKLAMMPGFVDGKKYEPNADGDSARPVFSVHEVQGETFPFVVLYRMNIYNATVLESKPHRVVATSRHLFRFIYRSPVGPEADPVARAVVEVGKLDDQVLRDIMLPTPQWLQDRMTKHAAKYAKYLD